MSIVYFYRQGVHVDQSFDIINDNQKNKVTKKQSNNSRDLQTFIISIIGPRNRRNNGRSFRLLWEQSSFVIKSNKISLWLLGIFKQ
jgi:hypothetical protein